MKIFHSSIDMKGEGEKWQVLDLYWLYLIPSSDSPCNQVLRSLGKVVAPLIHYLIFQFSAHELIFAKCFY